ncbi:MAG: DUF2628 domain-containing protein [Ruminococcus sp.]|jgi:hypothetical protein|nr:DUF2628 domain-containing protein [Ruminococcus sp.]
MEFIGKACSVCRNLFEIEDVPVVCPYCGKPFHRDCYMKAGGKICPVCDNKGIVEDVVDRSDNSTPSQYFDRNGNPLPPPLADQNGNLIPPLFFDGNGMPVPPPQYFDRNGNPVSFENQGQWNTTGEQNQNGWNTGEQNQNGWNTGEQNQNGWNTGEQNQNQWNTGEQNQGQGPIPPVGGSLFNLFQALAELEKIKANKDGKDLSETVTNGEFGKFIKTGIDEYFINFKKFFKERKNFSFNFIAFLWPEVYFAYRKMYLWWAISLVFAVLNIFPTIISAADITLADTLVISLLNLSTGLVWFFKIAMMAFANYLFYKHCEKSIKRIKEENQDNTEKAYQVYGGVSLLNVGICLGVQIVLVVLSYFLISNLV